MSHTNDFTTVIGDQEALIRALVCMGIPREQIEVHETPVRLRTYHEEEVKYAHIVVRKPLERDVNWINRHSDAGWERTDEGLFVGHVDSYNYGSHVPHFSEEWQQKLYTHCNYQTLKLEYERRGMEVTETKEKDGRLQLRAKFKKVATKETSTRTRIRS
jgi:hypothetical protein